MTKYLTDGSGSDPRKKPKEHGFHMTREDLDDLPSYESQEELDAAYARAEIDCFDYQLAQNELAHPPIYQGGQPGYRDNNSNVYQMDEGSFRKVVLLEAIERSGVNINEPEPGLVRSNHTDWDITSWTMGQRTDPAKRALSKILGDDVIQTFDMVPFAKHQGRSSDFYLRVEGAYERLQAGGTIAEFIEEYNSACTITGTGTDFVGDLRQEVADLTAAQNGQKAPRQNHRPPFVGRVLSLFTRKAKP